ncbi:hydrolase [Lentilactobacillus parafarraginis]|jgi:cell wall-associated NlpC family hydrolase|uniref:NlpC P60 family protein n=3 Tax=Lentilactobacillus parafarraginis TaxID=390842 RepID=A0A0R1YNG8_9LACO|nr:NlpC/P60 family protein [Lentilactobacillus parafarraginis]EHM00253.1 NlpC/P60 family protein [Lentilactobacillus parafarraginis F0439]KRM44008.1 NlpC P60 family protein [Lentilactobacillus parafarraginis DSM 18390 = JCM 14109]TLQ20386.1 hydrolase [Lentilactobacillus parafarraginis]
MKLHKQIILVVVAFFALLTAGFSTASAAKADDDASYSSLYTVAKQNLGKPYVWGATGPSSFDCSGFTSYVYKKGAGVKLPRTAQAQYNAEKKVSYSNLQKGDLVFFGGSTSSISHVGMYIGNGKMVDAQNRGVITENVKAPWWHYVGGVHVTDLDD